MRLMERAAARAGLPLKYSQGFNPRPRLSLPLPRPVGVQSRCELMVIELDAEARAGALARALGEQLPRGMTVQGAQPLPPGRPPQVTSATYELALRAEERPRVKRRLEELSGMQRWEVTRQAKPTSRSGRAKARTIDVKGRVGRLGCEGGRLSATLFTGPSGSVRCRELLTLVGLAGADEGEPHGAPAAAETLSRLRRTEMECDFGPHRPPGRNGAT